ncbi:AAA family ATPase [Pseudomonas sp. S60]|uniref:AAA family ATPase n=1 Tax=Pseudomonas sp. S60 TaxID=211124 RepID=UPI001912A90B|nr:AAA family ATPase [Pseudomonas sp. S60]MBK5009781.1 AAA family ATPase [Pseudomonas sp. S60]
MRLKSVKLTHFRGYRATTVIPIDEAMTGIVGRNDYGKSTILEALAIFFESGDVKADRSDINCFSLAEGAEQFEIACEFDDLPGALVLDENAETSLAQEYLLNAEGALEIVKTFKANTGKLERTVIRCQHPADEALAGLLSLKMAELKKLGEQHGIADQVADKRVASQWRQAIRAAAQPIICQEMLLDVSKGLSTDSKSIWEKIEAQLPTFALFKADRESSDGDAEAKNPLQQAVKEAQAELQDQISALEQQIEASVLDVAERTLDKLREMAPELANELKPRFKEKPKWSFSFTLDGENGIPINKRGSGVRRLILLNFFRAEAEKAVVGSQRNVIYAIEEPETSQHPNYQMMLMKVLLELSNQLNRQIIVTTHVPALAGLMPIDGIRYVTKDENGIPVVKMPNDDVLKEAAESLGVLPETGMERAKGVVLVEGKSDVTFLRHAANTLRAGGHLNSSLEDAGIVPILIGGCGSVKHWVTLNLADDLGLPWCVFLDSDIGGSPEQVASIAKRKQEVEGRGRSFYSTRKREIENYLCPDMIDAQTGVRVAFTDTCDAKKIIGQAVRVKADDVIDKFWPHMTAEQILQRSMYQEGTEQRSELKELVQNLLALVG